VEDPDERPDRPREQRPPVAQDGREHPALRFDVAADQHRVHERVGVLEHDHIGPGLDDASGARPSGLPAILLTRRQLETAVFAWIEGWYNRRRLHSTLGYVSPETFENGTLGKDGTGLAASRLAHSEEIIKEKAA